MELAHSRARIYTQARGLQCLCAYPLCRSPAEPSLTHLCPCIHSSQTQYTGSINCSCLIILKNELKSNRIKRQTQGHFKAIPQKLSLSDSSTLPTPKVAHLECSLLGIAFPPSPSGELLSQASLVVVPLQAWTSD